MKGSGFGACDLRRALGVPGVVGVPGFRSAMLCDALGTPSSVGESPGWGFRVWSLEFGFGFWGLGCRVWGLKFWCLVFFFLVFGVWGLGFRVWVLGFRI